MELDKKSLDYILLKKNIRLFTFGLQFTIFEKKLYGDKSFYEESNLSNMLCEIKSVKGRFYRKEKNIISADLLLGVDTTLILDKSNSTYFGYFTYTINFILNKGIKNLKIDSLNVGDTMRENDKEHSLDDNLVPYINYNHIDDIAEEFLNEFYPEALMNPLPIDMAELLNRMNLDLKNGLLKSNIKGIISFKDGYIDTIDEDNCIEVHPGTIVFNDNIGGLNQVGIYNNTIIHECIHWWLHKNYIELKMLFNSKVDKIECPADKEIDCIEDTSLKTIEIQARALAPLILMPRDVSIIKFNELLFKYNTIANNSKVVYEQAIREFASYFGVTIASAKNRLEKLGYNESLSKNDNLRIKSRKNIKFLTYWDYCKVSENEKLNYLLENNLVIYVDNYIVPSLPELLNRKNNEIHLSEYAKKHIFEYAMLFNVEWIENEIEDNYLMHSLYSSGTTSRVMTIPEEAYLTLLNIYVNAPESNEKRNFFKLYRTNDLEFIDEVTYGKYLHIVMERHNVTVGELESRSGLSQSLIKKYRSSDYQIHTLESTLIICATLKLYPYESLTLLEIQGWDYEGKKAKGIKMSPLDDKYYELITECYDSGLRVWNEKLNDSGFPKLQPKK